MKHRSKISLTPIVWAVLFSVVPFSACLAVQTNDGPPSISESIEDSFSSQEFVTGRPRGLPIGMDTQWIVDSDVGLWTIGTEARIPLLFLRPDSGPPPMIGVGFNYTDLAATAFGLPGDLYETSFGLTWVKPINDRWAIRAILGADFATDGQNLSSDSWQFRGGAFAIYTASPRWTWSFGAIALGREDLPVVPAVGAIWTPSESVRCDFLLPRPRINFLLTDDGQRQNWAYCGLGLEGNTWGYQRNNGSDDQLSYGDWRVTVGWQSRPSAPANAPFVLGRKYSAELGYAFSRDLEFDNRNQEISLDGAFLIRFSTSY